MKLSLQFQRAINLELLASRDYGLITLISALFLCATSSVATSNVKNENQQFYYLQERERRFIFYFLEVSSLESVYAKPLCAIYNINRDTYISRMTKTLNMFF